MFRNQYKISKITFQHYVEGEVYFFYYTKYCIESLHTYFFYHFFYLLKIPILKYLPHIKCRDNKPFAVL